MRRGQQSPEPGTRGQSYVLEAIAAGVIVVAGVIFAIQATAVTPLSVSTANEHVENQERAMAETVLERTAASGALKEAVLYWNPDNRTFYDAEPEGYLGESPPNAFGHELERVFTDARIATNVYVVYSRPSGQGLEPMVYQGTPSDNAVTATHSLVLTDDDTLSAPGYDEYTLNATNDTDGFYARDVVSDGRTYNVVEVRLVAWQM